MRDEDWSNLNRDEFLKEVTFRICSSLDIKKSLSTTYDYMRLFLPIDELFLIILDRNLNALRRIAYAGRSDMHTPDEIVPLPEKILKVFEEKKDSGPIIFGAGEHDSILPMMPQKNKLEGKSLLVVPLRIDSDPIGALNFWAHGEKEYTEKHAELLGSVAKPFAIALANALAHEAVVRYQNTLLDDNRFLNRELYAQAGEDIIGGRTGLRNVMEMVHHVAPLNNTVLLLGETGTGKDVIAGAIHFSSPRKNGPFIKVNCGAIPENLIDSELFGHERGAFTGAIAASRGRFERAENGTIFLDEIGELPLAAQVRLLRVLQNHEIERLGGNRTISINVRVIAATHRNLPNMIAERTFREDLWFRLNTFPILIPPLRQRKGDVPALIRHFLAAKTRELGLSSSPGVAPGALARLADYEWPGNVRELENLVERELILHREGMLNFETGEFSHAPRTTSTADSEGLPHPMNLEEAIAIHITRVLKGTKGKIYGPGGAAELLGINPTTLRSRLDKLGISYRRKGRS